MVVDLYTSKAIYCSNPEEWKCLFDILELDTWSCPTWKNPRSWGWAFSPALNYLPTLRLDVSIWSKSGPWSRKKFCPWHGGNSEPGMDSWATSLNRKIVKWTAGEISDSRTTVKKDSVTVAKLNEIAEFSLKTNFEETRQMTITWREFEGRLMRVFSTSLIITVTR